MTTLPTTAGPIGIFDSGYGGLTVLTSIRRLLPRYDYLYLGDNARAPYGTRSFDVVYEYTRQAVMCLFRRGCHLVILACNTASAKALRSIQQRDLPAADPQRRVLGVIRPTAEAIGALTTTRHVGILATEGTIRSESYDMEIHKFFPDITVRGVACPLWVPLVEHNECGSPGADYFVRKSVDQLMTADSAVDAVILGCTHYPLLIPVINRHIPRGVRVIAQGHYVAESLKDYLRRHPEMETKCTRGGNVRFLTTESPDTFRVSAKTFLNENIEAENICLS